MDLIADILLLAGAAGAGIYCFVLSRRLTRFTDLEQGVGGAVAMLSVQVDDLKKALEEARHTAVTAAEGLEETTERADAIAQKLETLLSASHAGTSSGVVPQGAQRSVRRKRRGQVHGTSMGDAA